MHCMNGNALFFVLMMLLTIKYVSPAHLTNNTEDNEESCEMDDDLKELQRQYHCKVQTRSLPTHDEQCPLTYVARDFCIFVGDPIPDKDNATCTFQCKANTSKKVSLLYRCHGGAVKTMDAVEHEDCQIVYQNRENETEDDGPLVSFAVMVYLYVQPVVTFGGLFGNTLSFILMTSKSMREYSFSNYLAVLAVTDSICLLHFGMDWIDEVSGKFPFQFRFDSVLSCKLYPYIIQVNMLMSSWLLTIFSIDRCINICYPFYAGGIFTKLGSKIIILILFVTISSLQLYVPILHQESSCAGIFYVQFMPGVVTSQGVTSQGVTSQGVTSQGVTSQGVTSQGVTSQGVTSQGDLAMVSRILLLVIFPFLCVLVSNCKIICAVRSRVTPSVSNEHNTRKAERRMTIKLVSLSASFLVLTTPDTLRAIVNMALEFQGETEAVVGLRGLTAVTWLIFTLNFAINFLFYGITFRDKLPPFLRCKIRKHRPPISQTIETGTTMSIMQSDID